MVARRAPLAWYRPGGLARACAAAALAGLVRLAGLAAAASGDGDNASSGSESGSSVCCIAHTDTDARPDIIGGVIEWTPPLDTQGIVHYAVSLAADELNTENRMLLPFIPVGTNRLVISNDGFFSGRTFAWNGARCHWIIVVPYNLTNITMAVFMPMPLLSAHVPLVDLGSTTTSTAPASPVTPDPAAAVCCVSFADVDSRPLFLEGRIEWSPPADTSTVTRYAIFLAADELNVRRKQIGGQDASQRWVEVGTNQVDVYGGTTMFTLENEACNWIFVVPFDGDEEGPLESAARLPLSDLGGSQPQAVCCVTYADTDVRAEMIQGIVEWTPPAVTQDVTRYAVFVAADEENAERAQLRDRQSGSDWIPVGTNRLDIYDETRAVSGSGAKCHWVFVVPYDGGAAGPLSWSGKLALTDLFVETTTTVTTTTTVDADRVPCCVAYSDTDGRADAIQGVIQWTPPVNTEGITRYAVFIAVDEQNTKRAQLWDRHLSSNWIPVGSNQLDIYDNTYRLTSQQEACNWIVVVPYDGSAAAPLSRSAKLPLVDLAVTAVTTTEVTTTVAPGSIVCCLAYTDTDVTPGGIQGVVEWTPPAVTQDVTRYAVFIAADEQNVDGAMLWDRNLGSSWVPVGTNRLDIYDGTKAVSRSGATCRWILVVPYNGGAAAPLSRSGKLALVDVAVETPAEATTTAAPAPTTADPTRSACCVTYSDTDIRRNVIQGVVQWTPPANTAGITRYAVFVAADEQNTRREHLWDRHLVDMWIPVGTNSLDIYDNTKMLTSQREVCNWIFVVPYEGNAAVPLSRSARLPLVDFAEPLVTTTAAPAVTTTAPAPSGGSSVVCCIVYSDTDSRSEVIQGVVEWTPPADTADITRYAVFIAADSENTKREHLWDQGLYSNWIPVGTNKLHIYAGTHRVTRDGELCEWLFVVPYAGTQEAPFSSSARASLVDAGGPGQEDG